MSPVFAFSLALYATAVALASTAIVSGSRRSAALARGALAAGFAAQGGVLLWGLWHEGRILFGSAGDSWLFLAWCLAFVALFVDRNFHAPSLAVLLAPPLLLSLAAGLLLSAPAGGPGPVLANRFWRGLHGATAIASIAVFALGFAGGTLYLLQERALKRKEGAGYGWLPALETLDLLSYRAVVLGVPVFTVSLLVGAVLAHGSPDGGRALLRQPFALASAAAWLVYGALLAARFLPVVHRRQIARWQLVGFSLALLAFAGFSALVRGAGPGPFHGPGTALRSERPGPSS